MDRLFKSAISVRELKPHTDDDYADRLSRLYTVTVLVCFAFLVTTKQFVGSPIHCWCPAQFTDSQRDYADAVCWVSNTYYLPIDQTIPGDRLDTAAAKIGYYQWVPLLLAGQAVLAFLPCQLWRFLCQRSGINLAAMMDAAHVSSDAGYLEVRAIEQLYSPREVAYNNIEQYKQKQDRTDRTEKKKPSNVHIATLHLSHFCFPCRW